MVRFAIKHSTQNELNQKVICTSGTLFSAQVVAVSMRGMMVAEAVKSTATLVVAMPTRQIPSCAAICATVQLSSANLSSIAVTKVSVQLFSEPSRLLKAKSLIFSLF